MNLSLSVSFVYLVRNTCVGRLSGVRRNLTEASMKACFLRTPTAVENNPLEYGEVSRPEPAAGQVLVRVEVCGVCRTDLHVIEGELAPRKSPVIPGHQAV